MGFIARSVIGWMISTSVAFAGDLDKAGLLADFRDGSNHWRKKHDRTDYPVHHADDVRPIAENILLLQRSNGGWPPNEEVLRVLTAAEKQTWQENRHAADTSFDNRTTYPHVRYLAFAFQQTQDERYRAAALHGIDFILSAETPCGGWPHSYPREGAYYRHITLMDDVTVGVLRTLRDVTNAKPPFEWVDSDCRERCRHAVERGTDLLLRLQVKMDGQLTIWAGQYSEGPGENKLTPCAARSFEPPSLTAHESVEVVRYLMEIEPSTHAIDHAITSALAWYHGHPVRGFRLQRVPAPPERYSDHTSRDDIQLVADPSAPPLWARFYDLVHGRPLLCDRNGKIVDRLEELSRERRTGYSWFGPYARDLLERDEPAWRARHTPPTP
jgi:PelA/Pel-15E family pectate lyase